jgi:hypothetical protein
VSRSLCERLRCLRMTGLVGLAEARTGHGFGVDGFLAGYAFQAGEDAVVVVFVALCPTSRAEREKWGTRFLFRRPRSTKILRWESLAFASDSAASG